MVKNKEVIFKKRWAICALPCAVMLLNFPAASLADPHPGTAQSNAFAISSASWSSSKSRLRVSGTGQNGESVDVVNAATLASIGSDDVGRRDTWRVTSRNPSSVPCSVQAIQSDGQTAVMDVANAPADCDARW